MDEVLYVLRRIEVYHHLHALHVQASSRQVRGDQDVVLLVLEPLHGLLPLRLILASMVEHRIKAVPLQDLLQELDRLFLVGENDDRRLRNFQQLQQAVSRIKCSYTFCETRLSSRSFVRCPSCLLRARRC